MQEAIDALGNQIKVGDYLTYNTEDLRVTIVRVSRIEEYFPSPYPAPGEIRIVGRYVQRSRYFKNTEARGWHRLNCGHVRPLHFASTRGMVLDADKVPEVVKQMLAPKV